MHESLNIQSISKTREKSSRSRSYLNKSVQTSIFNGRKKNVETVQPNPQRHSVKKEQKRKKEKKKYILPSCDKRSNQVVVALESPVLPLLASLVNISAEVIISDAIIFLLGKCGDGSRQSSCRIVYKSLNIGSSKLKSDNI